VFLTEKGEEVFHQVKKAFFEYDGEFSKKLSDEDKKEFLRLMKIVTENPPPDSMKIDR
jgi:DNA-binding MarR family transcriptional regulator